MSNNLVLRARGGLDRDMDSLIDNLRHRFAAQQPGSNPAPLSQAMLFQAMSHNSLNNHHNNDLQKRPHQTGAQNAGGRQAQVGRLSQRAQLEPPASRSIPQKAAQCAPLDLSVKTNSSISHSSSRLRVASSQSRSLNQRRQHQQQQQQQHQHQNHQQQQQNLSLDMLKTIAQVIIREKSVLNQPRAKAHHLSQQQRPLNHHLMQHTQLISSSASSVSDYNGQSPERTDCNLVSANISSNNHDGDHEIGRHDEVDIARRLTAAAAAAAAADATPASTNHHQTDVISSTNGRRSRRQGANSKRQKASKSHLCNHCGRSFVRSDMLTRHSRLHSGHKPYQCGKCLQVFSRSDHLSTHERTHTGEKPYQCGICAYSACRRDMITRHMRTHLGQREKHRQSADGSVASSAATATSMTVAAADQVHRGGELVEASFASNGANSNETNSNAQSPSSIATTILMADVDEEDEDDRDQDHDDEGEEETKGEITSFLYRDNRSL